MNNEKDKNLTRFLLTFFLGWIGSIIINATDLKPKGYKSRSLAYFFLTAITFGIYGLVASISNLSFDPAKESNIGYIKEEGYVYNANSYQNDTIDSVIDGNQSNTSVKNMPMNVIIRKVIVLVMAIFALITLAFTLCESGYVENGFTFITFRSDFISGSYSWAIYLIGVFSILFLLISLLLIALSIFNFFLKKRFNFNLIVVIASIVISVLYMVIGIVLTSVCKATYGYQYYFKTIAYVPLILQVVFLVAYIICGKIKIPTNTSKQNDSQSTITITTTTPKTTMSPEEVQIKKFKDLLDRGLITEEEFDAKRKHILGI